MSDLKLIPVNENRTSGEWSDEDYDVVLAETGEHVGRLFRATVSHSNPAPWFWGIDSFKAKGRSPHYGYAETKKAAKVAFARCWRRPEIEIAPEPE